MPNSRKAINPSDTPPHLDFARVALKMRLLSPAERAEIQRQGAKAAARGEAADANPFWQPRNDPSATGGSTDRWSQRSAAWKRSHEAQTATRWKAQPAPSQEDADEYA